LKLILIRVQWARLLFLALVIGVTSGALAEDDPIQDSIARYKSFLTVYAGAHAQDHIGDVFTFKPKFEDNAYVGVVALARQFWHYKKYISFEVEGQIGKHFNTDDQWEFVGLITARWHEFPWNNYVNTSFAVGDGISYYTEISNVEKKDDEDAQYALNYLMFELTLGLPQYPKWDLVLRIHHRSSMFGLVGPAGSGSNFVCGGFKYSF
jgi:hypothetical protein